MNVGDIVEEAEVYDAKVGGAYLKLGDKYRGFCSSNHLSDTLSNKEKLKKRYSVGSKHPCRIISYNFVDHTFLVSLKKSDLGKQVIIIFFLI